MSIFSLSILCPHNDACRDANRDTRLQQLDVIYFLNSTKSVSSDEEVMEEMASKLKELRKITIPKYSVIPDEYPVTNKILVAMTSNCMLLNKIVCRDNFVSDDIGYALRYCSNLNSLKVKYRVPCLMSPTSLSIEKSISNARGLNSLAFYASSLSDALLSSIAEAHLPLKKLKLDHCIKTSQSGLSILLQEYHSLSRFEFIYSKDLTDQHMNHLSSYLCNITHINLSCCSNLTNSTFLILAKSCPLLVCVKMDKTLPGHEDNLEVVLKKNFHLQNLKLRRDYCLNDAALKKLGYVCPSLQILDLSLCWDESYHCGLNITEEGIGAIMKSCSGIRHFKVNKCKLETILGTDSDFSKLNIEVMEAKESKINDKGMEMIGIRCPGLQKLDLMGCANMTTEGVRRVVEKCPKLREIDLIGCHNVGLDVLPWMLKKRPSLRKIFSPDPSLVTEEDKILFMRHGCRLC